VKPATVRCSYGRRCGRVDIGERCV
jgi:hypothetical protein